MKLTLQLRLVPDGGQAALLKETMARFNAAAGHAARVGFEAGVFSQPPIHKRCYRELRERYGLSAQMAVRAIAKAVEAFKRDRSRCPAFRADGAITYDQRILSFKGLDMVSLWTMAGRQRIPMVYGQYQRERLGRLKGQVDLVCRQGGFFLYATVEVPEAAPLEVQDFLGVDLGIVNIAADSDGETYSGGQVNGLRKRHVKLRARLQKKASKPARRLLAKRRFKESRFARDVNHCISKKLVAKAQGTKRAIVLENLKGIRSRLTVRQLQRRQQHSWAFSQLRSFVEYKAQLAGVPVVLVDPRNTSRTCPSCGHVAQANRLSQARFSCVSCGLAGPADTIAAQNICILGRAAVNQPHVSPSLVGVG